MLKHSRLCNYKTSIAYISANVDRYKRKGALPIGTIVILIIALFATFLALLVGYAIGHHEGYTYGSAVSNAKLTKE